jgi:hypothetical protein
LVRSGFRNVGDIDLKSDFCSWKFKWIPKN